MKFGLSEKDWLLLDKILIQPLKKHSVKIWIFGSRARGDHAQFSDIDILYSLPKGATLPPGLLFSIKDDLEESNLPYKIDLVSEAEMAKSYLPSVLQDRIEI